MVELDKSAVIADMSDAAASGLSALLAARGWRVCKRLRSGNEVVRAVAALRPALVILDEVLPVLDGLTAAEKVLEQPLTVRPGIIVTRLLPGLTPRIERLRQDGCAVIAKPVTAETLQAAIAETALPVRRIPERKRRTLRALLERLGLPERSGREYLEAAILFAWQDARLTKGLTRGLYPLVAARFGTDCAKIERDMRRAIDYAWKYGAIEEQHAIFGGTIDAQRGKPTSGAMIAQLADILRLEG